VSPWGAAPVPSTPTWPSDIGDDHSPYEFSIAFAPNESPAVRFLVEAQGAEPTFAHTRDAALALTRRLVAQGVDLARFERVRDLFLPDVPNARFALWHAARLSGSPEVKAYFNPQIAGKARSFELVESAMRTLGFGSAWPTLLHAAQRTTIDDEIRYFALDLAAGSAARAKVYLYQRDVTTAHLERMAAVRPGYAKGEVTEFCRAMTGTSEPHTAFPFCTYLSFIEGQAVPNEVAIQIPIRFYARNDAVARDRITAFMRARGLPADAYEAALDALAPRTLDAGAGLTTYVSLRTGTDRLTVYIATELFGPPLSRASGGVDDDDSKARSRQRPRLQSSQPEEGKMP
jgi:DMATS type aromatic prenyltransferase